MKHKTNLHIEKNALVDEGEGYLRFPSKLVITDNSPQKNGTRYDIDSMDIYSEYNGQVTADHVDSIQTLIGEVRGLAKQGSKVVIDGIRFAVKENPLALLAYNLMKGGFLKAVSIETYGSEPDDMGIYKGAKLVGLSTVVVGNNNSAVVNEIVHNSFEQAKQQGMDTEPLESIINKETNMSDVKNEGGDAPAPAPVADPAPVVEEAVDVAEVVKNAVAAAVAPFKKELEEVKEEAFNKNAPEPAFTPAQNKAPVRSNPKNEFKALGWEDRAVNQIESFRLLEKFGDYEAGKTLRTINELNLEELKEKGLVKNAITIGDLGNYVISPEQLTEIQGFRSDYSGLVNRFSFRETLSTVTQWLKRSGDISMTHVEYDDSSITDADYLKPLDDYSASLQTMTLEELAAVTPVANAATRFLAADILADVNAGYRTDYQRKLAQLIVARLEQAVDANGNSESYTTTSDINAVKDFTNVIGELAEEVPNGIFVMNHKTYWQFVSRATGATVSGPLASGLITTGNQPTIFGRPVEIVPNDLLPTLNTAETVTHVIEGSNVTIDHSVFYVNPTNFVGRVSGGLQYDLSTDAAYETGGTVYSAFQRNQIVLRGSFFRAGQVANTDLVSGLLSEGVS